MVVRRVSQIGEAGVINRICRSVTRDRSVLIGLGDDAAVLKPPKHGHLLFASDLFVEGVHFLKSRVPAPWIGWKALAANISDIAAMGGIPHWAVVSLGLSPATPVKFVDQLYAGLSRCARQYGLSIVGGDTTKSSKIIIDVAIIGSVSPENVVLRSGAQVGDILFVTGKLGGSYISGRHARFTPRLFEAQKLLKCVRLHAMMDLSDGLANDLWQMSRASRVKMQVDAARIPVSRAGRTLKHALMDGEDFELLFAVSPQEASRVPRRIGTCAVTPVGSVIGRGVGVSLKTAQGTIQPLNPEGFRHF